MRILLLALFSIFFFAPAALAQVSTGNQGDLILVLVSDDGTDIGGGLYLHHHDADSLNIILNDNAANEIRYYLVDEESLEALGVINPYDEFGLVRPITDRIVVPTLIQEMPDELEN